MAILEEVSGARERPGGCRIVVRRLENGATSITIPPRAASPFVVVPACILLLNLLLTLYMGAMLFFAHRSVLFMSEIAPNDLPRSMHPFEPWFVFGWLFLEAIGFWTLLAIVRPLFTREYLMLDRQEVTQGRHAFGRSAERRFPRAIVNGFHLKRDPQGFVQSALTLQTRGEEVEVAEHSNEADREWLASVANVLLREL